MYRPRVPADVAVRGGFVRVQPKCLHTPVSTRSTRRSSPLTLTGEDRRGPVWKRRVSVRSSPRGSRDWSLRLSPHDWGARSGPGACPRTPRDRETTADPKGPRGPRGTDDTEVATTECPSANPSGPVRTQGRERVWSKRDQCGPKGEGVVKEDIVSLPGPLKTENNFWCSLEGRPVSVPPRAVSTKVPRKVVRFK